MAATLTSDETKIYSPLLKNLWNTVHAQFIRILRLAQVCHYSPDKRSVSKSSNKQQVILATTPAAIPDIE